MKMKFARTTKIGGRTFERGEVIEILDGQVVDGVGVRVPEIPSSTFLQLKFSSIITPVRERERVVASLCFA